MAHSRLLRCRSFAKQAEKGDLCLRGGSLREGDSTVVEWICSFTTIPVFALPWRRLSLADVFLIRQTIKKPPIQYKIDLSVIGHNLASSNMPMPQCDGSSARVRHTLPSIGFQLALHPAFSK
jgi:hypothetical protein